MTDPANDNPTPGADLAREALSDFIVNMAVSMVRNGIPADQLIAVMIGAATGVARGLAHDLPGIVAALRAAADDVESAQAAPRPRPSAEGS
jgi:hypothetical protein